MNFNAKVALCVLLVRRRKRRQRRWWIHPVISDRSTKGKFYLLHAKLKEHPQKFFDFYRMSVSSFNDLLGKLHDKLQKKNTVMRSAIGPEEKLAVTLRYLGTGCSFGSLHYEFLLGRSTVGCMVKETCEAICEELTPLYMKKLTKEDWLTVSDKFQSRANFPNCIGAVEGKHIKITCPSRIDNDSKSKKYLIILMVIADADYNFTYVDISDYERISDSNIFKESAIRKKLYSNLLDLPEPATLPNDDGGNLVPYLFVGDRTFAVSSNLMRLYPGRNLSPEKKNFNYRLSRAKRFVDCAFGILANKWRIFDRPIAVSPDFAELLIKTCCVLHNYVNKRDGFQFEDTLMCPLQSIEAIGTRGSQEGLNIRNYLTEYFSSSRGSMPYHSGSQPILTCVTLGSPFP